MPAHISKLNEPAFVVVDIYLDPRFLLETWTKNDYHLQSLSNVAVNNFVCLLVYHNLLLLFELKNLMCVA